MNRFKIKYLFVVILVFLVLVTACAKPKEVQPLPASEIRSGETPQTAVPEEKPAELPAAEQPEQQITVPEEPQPAIEQTPLPAEQPVEQKQLPAEPKIPRDIQQIISNSEKVKSYLCRYASPAGPEYKIYVKGNNIRIDSISASTTMLLDTKEKTAAEYCLSYSRCGAQFGKIRHLDYNAVYLETPTDWLSKITEAKKITEASFRGKYSWQIDTNIGQVWIDRRYGFIYQVKTGSKEYNFYDETFNLVQDSDVLPPQSS